MASAPLVESPPLEVARRADLGAYRFAVSLESRQPVVGGGLAVVAAAVAGAPFSHLFDVVMFGRDPYPVVAWVSCGLVASAFAIVAALLLRRPAPVYCFDAGAVRGADARSWAEAAPFEWVDSGPHLRLAGFGAVSSADVERVAALIAEWGLPHARALIDAGEPVVFGPVTVTRDALILDGVPAPWADVREPVRTDDTLSLFASDRAPVRLRRRDVPHESTLVQLIREHRPV